MRAQSIVDIHNYLLEKAPAYGERCCFSEPPLFDEALPKEKGSGEDSESVTAKELVSASTIIFQWYSPDHVPSTSKQLIDGFVLLGKGQVVQEDEPDQADAGSFGSLAKVTLEVSAARELCAMFSSARNSL